MSDAAISVRGLRKSYGDHEAVAGIDFEVGAGEVFGLLVYVALGTATLCTLGIALTPFTPTPDAASTIAPFSVVILTFVSGVWIPIDQLPHWLEQVGRIFPLFHLATGLQSTLSPEASGLGLEGDNISPLLVWMAIGGFVATRRFRWEPLAGTG